ncbi:MAG: hypothetical protein GXP13_05395 [Gammaproteobacteria bacterium]|nr:hypothetical protein [Gammaproteobacteria bacterium]
MEEKKEYMTFKSGHSLYAVPIENVLTINGLPDELHCRSFGQDGVLGVVEYLNRPVVVFDFAQATNMKSSMEEKQELIAILHQREQDHVDWLNALETSIKEGVEFSKAKDPHKCAFGAWYDQFETDDEDLADVMKEFDAPHQKIHSLADQLLGMCAEDNQAGALEILEYERKTTLAKIRQLFTRTRDLLAGSIKPILIYLTLDGEVSQIALKVDEIANVERVKPEDLVSYDDIGLPHFDKTRQFVDAYMTLESGKECLLIRPDKILTRSEVLDVAKAI